MTAQQGNVRVEVDPAKLAQYLRSPSGPLFREMVEAGEIVKRGAQRRVGVHTPQPGENRSRRPGTLRDSIVKRVVVTGGVPGVEVGSDDEIALLHHEGTEPHIIRPRRRPRLVFYWPKVGRVVAATQVNHPGTQPNRYLTDSLRDLRSRY